MRFQKQTYRNRSYIYGPNGKLRLVVPIVHNQKKYRTDCETQIFNQIPWKKTHWKTLCASYRSSPYFEFYEDRLYPLYQCHNNQLFEFNLQLIQTICGFLNFDLDYNVIKAVKGQHHVVECLLNAKNQIKYSLNQYHQVFGNKYGFISNLSIVDLLFNVGPDSLIFLKKLNLKTNRTSIQNSISIKKHSYVQPFNDIQ